MKPNVISRPWDSTFLQHEEVNDCFRAESCKNVRLAKVACLESALSSIGMTCSVTAADGAKCVLVRPCAIQHTFLR